MKSTREHIALILRYSNPGDFVLDPFLGSGTSLIEAKLLDRYGIGVDLNKQNVESANRKLCSMNGYEHVLKKGDVTTKEGDDYAARVYVTFEYDPKTASLFETALVKLGRLIYGEDPPIATINYIWANKAPVGTIVQSPFTKLDKMIVVETGEVSLNRWITEERNIFDDYVKAFGEPPPMVSGVAIMTDSDNTKESAIAFYGDILFKQK